MRSKLFVPASRPELFGKSLASAADSVSFDLEDSVGPDRKGTAREALAAALASADWTASPKVLIVRVNAPTSAHFAADLEVAIHARVDYLNLPKVESAEEVTLASAAIAAIEKARGSARTVPLLVNIESPRALRSAAAIAQADPRVAGLQLGFADLLEPLGIDRRNAAAVQQIQLMVRLAAGEAGRWAYDAAFPDIKDAEAFRAEAQASRRLGFLGKSCIHPSQIAIANEVFQPTEAEIEHARRIVAAAANHSGAFALDGQMVDEPFVRRARALLAAAPAR